MNDDNVVDALYGGFVDVSRQSGLMGGDDTVVLKIFGNGEEELYLSPVAARELAQILVREAAGN